MPKLSEKKFQLMAELSADYIFQFDLDGTLAYCSPSIENILGYTPAEAVGKNIREHLTKSEFDKITPHFQEVISGIPQNGLEVECITKTGDTVSLEINAAPFWENNHIFGIFGIARDITQRKKQHEELYDKQKTIDALLNVPDCEYLVLDRNATILDANIGMAIRFDTSLKNVIGRNALDPLPPKVAKSRKVLLERVFKTGEGCRYEDRIENLSFDHSLSPIKSPNGTVTKVAILCRDITYIKTIEQQLRETVALLEKQGERRSESLCETQEMLCGELQRCQRISKELQKKEKELHDKIRKIEEAETALTVLLRKRDEERRALAEEMMIKVTQGIQPSLKKLRKSGLSENQQTYLKFIESKMTHLFSTASTLDPLWQNVTLTPTEKQIAALIRENKSSKEIAEVLDIAKSTVDTHRENIRKKIGIKNKKTTLKKAILSIN
ncbi:MAG: PAS domain S-box protein [Proteobacteria bacterium]|nr:PAS domain S-box protein [Pseudomonadota bacterium]MBU1687191.1 PAS domain S-box protein [Pseudomonadota bacterium]